MDQSSLPEAVGALATSTTEPVAQTSPSLRSNRLAKRALRSKTGIFSLYFRPQLVSCLTNNCFYKSRQSGSF